MCDIQRNIQEEFINMASSMTSSKKETCANYLNGVMDRGEVFTWLFLIVLLMIYLGGFLWVHP